MLMHVYDRKLKQMQKLRNLVVRKKKKNHASEKRAEEEQRMNKEEKLKSDIYAMQYD